jgi:ABC-type multidrug transport system fused ATPase/permease subunit
VTWVKNNEWLRPDADHRVHWLALKRFLGNYRPFTAMLLTACGCAVIGSITIVFLPFIFRSAERAIAIRDLPTLLLATGGLAGVLVSGALATYVLRRLCGRISTTVNRDLTLRYYQKLLNISVEDFVDFRQRSNLFQRIIDATLITAQCTEALVLGAQAMFLIVMASIAIVLISPVAFAVIAVGVIALVILVVVYGRQLGRLRARVLGVNYPLVGKMTEIIDGLMIIKALAASPRVTQDVLDLSKRKRDADYSEARCDALATQLTRVETGCGIVPYTYRDTAAVPALQWVVGLEAHPYS